MMYKQVIPAEKSTLTLEREMIRKRLPGGRGDAFEFCDSKMLWLCKTAGPDLDVSGQFVLVAVLRMDPPPTLVGWRDLRCVSVR